MAENIDYIGYFIQVQKFKYKKNRAAYVYSSGLSYHEMKKKKTSVVH